MKAINWIMAIFEDQSGSPSSKRFLMFICLAFLGQMVNGSLAGKPVNPDILMYVTGIILFCIGAVTSEFFKKT